MSAALYRAYAEDDQLLYIGVSEQLPGRFQAHFSTKPWWSEVARITAQFYLSRMDAYRAETAAVRTERPFYNARVRETEKRRHCRICGGRIAPRYLALDPEAKAHEKCGVPLAALVPEEVPT